MINYAVEKLDQCLEEMKPLIQAHWEEVSWYKDLIPLAPDWDQYYRMEDSGFLHIVTARDDGVLVGYYSSVITQGLHYMRTRFAMNDALFVHPDYRGGSTAYKMFKYAFKVLKEEEGVDCISIHMKTDFPFDKLCESLGMQRQEYLYSIYVGD